MRQQIETLLRCPNCHGHPLEIHGETSIQCCSCALDFPLVDGVPVLLSDAGRHAIDAALSSESGQKMLDEYRQSDNQLTASGKNIWLDYLRPPQVMLHLVPDKHDSPAAVIFENAERKRILNVGGGPRRESEHEITLNIRAFQNVDIVADAHEIPFADNSFDSVFSLAVIEHVAYPQRVVAEMIRVLKPGGFLYSEVPFIFFFHGYPSDYTRFTLEGMKRLFSALENPEFGMTHGPMSAVLQSANMVVDMLVPSRFQLLKRLVNGAYRLIFFPFKYLDLLLKNNPDAHKVAGGFYVVGKKPAA